MKDKTLKAKGRANSALRIGIREAREALERGASRTAIAALDRAIDRADRMEKDA